MSFPIPRHPRLSIREASKLLNQFELSSTSLATQCFERAIYGEESLQLNAFTHLLSEEDIQKQAKASEERYRLKKTKSILDGIPVTIKANIAVKGLPYTANSRILGGGQNDPHIAGMDAHVVKRLVHDSGAVLIGITNMDEFGMGSLGTNVSNSQSIPKNPLPYLHNEHQPHSKHSIDSDKDIPHFSTGGSSSGAASSIAFGSSLLSIGTDTGGSVRLPAAWNRVVGFKPTYGWISRHGLIEYASSLDTVGLITPSVDCAYLAFNALLDSKEQQQDLNHPYIVKDATVASGISPITLTSKELQQQYDLKQLRVGIPSSFCTNEMPPYIRDAWEKSAAHLYENCNANIVTIKDELLSSNTIKQSLAAYYVLACAEACSNLARYDGVRYGTNHVSEQFHNDFESNLSALEQQYSQFRSQFFGEEVIRRILCGNAVLSSDRFHTYYENATKLRSLLSKQFHDIFLVDPTKADVLLIPTSMSYPWNIEEHKEDAATKMYEQDILTVPMSLACLPTISVPIPSTSGAMDKNNGYDDYGINVLGMQVVGPRMGESNVLQTAQCLEAMKK